MDTEHKTHRQFAVETFNLTWEYLEKPDRSQEDNDAMIHAAHASRFHWGEAGTAVNLARGEWQISRVYAELKRSEPALYHAQRCLDICQENGIGDFDLAYAYEGLARASAVADDKVKVQEFLTLAFKTGEDISEEEDKEYFLKDIRSIPGFGSFKHLTE